MVLNNVILNVIKWSSIVIKVQNSSLRVSDPLSPQTGPGQHKQPSFIYNYLYNLSSSVYTYLLLSFYYYNYC